MPPGYGYLTCHLYMGRLTLGEAVQRTNRRVLALENEEKTRLRAEKYIHVQAPTATMNKNTGIQSAITIGTPVPPPQVRTTPLDGGGGLRSNGRLTNGAPSPAPAAATTTTSTPGGQTAAAMTSGRMPLPGGPRPCPNS
jgi:hypothetical protein